MRETVTLERDCDATVIPEGSKIKLPKGSKAEIMQSLGGSYTVVTERGYMVRIDAENADAIGKEISKAPTAEEAADQPVEKLVWDQLKTCYDPEIPINIADLGLIYRCDVTDHPEGGKQVFIQMTLTAPGCGMGETLKMDVHRKVEKLPGVREVAVELVWDPPWSQAMMSEAAKLKLGLL